MGEQLYKKGQETLAKVNPIVNYDDVIDSNGENLQKKFNRLNHLFLEYKNNSVVATRLQVPVERRRNGLWITYVNGINNIITEYYKGKDCSDIEFTKNKNWNRLASIELDNNGKILSSYLPSYVDDILEFDKIVNFPQIGERGKIYVDTETDLTYRWSGSKYTEVSKSIALGETETTAFPGNRGAILEKKIGELTETTDILNESRFIYHADFPETDLERENNNYIVNNRFLNNNLAPIKEWLTKVKINDSYYYFTRTIQYNGVGIYPESYYNTLYNSDNHKYDTVMGSSDSLGMYGTTIPKIYGIQGFYGFANYIIHDYTGFGFGGTLLACNTAANNSNRIFGFSQGSFMLKESNLENYKRVLQRFYYSNEKLPVENPPIITYIDHSTIENGYAGWLISRFTIPNEERKQYIGFALSPPEEDSHIRTALVDSSDNIVEYKKIAYLDDVQDANIGIDQEINQESENAVSNKAIYDNYVRIESTGDRGGVVHIDRRIDSANGIKFDCLMWNGLQETMFEYATGLFKIYGSIYSKTYLGCALQGLYIYTLNNETKNSETIRLIDQITKYYRGEKLYLLQNDSYRILSIEEYNSLLELINDNKEENSIISLDEN